MTSMDYPKLFVTAQFSIGGLMLVLAFILPTVSAPLLMVIGLVVVILAVVVLYAGIHAHQQVNAGTPNIVPTPRHSTELVRTGIYASIRHPLYTGVISGGFGLAMVHGHVVLVALSLILLTVMFFKSRYEESLLRAHYPEYATYMTETGRFLPRLR